MKIVSAIAVVCVVLSGVLPPADGDERPPYQRHAMSSSGSVLVRVTPGRRRADAARPADQVSIYVYDEEADTFSRTAHFDLGGLYPPEHLYVSDDAKFVAFANTFQFYKTPLALRIYSASGKLQSKFALQELLTADQIRACSSRGGVVAWLERADFGREGFTVHGPAKNGENAEVSFSRTIPLPLGLRPSSPDRVKIGVLHSLSGTMAISETSLRDVVLMAAEEINADGGVLGKKIEPVVLDPASDWNLFAEKAKDLVTKEKVAVTFGCYTSVSRKMVLPVYEENNALLFYPVEYEGEEQSQNVFYTGATPNLQLIPAAQYLMSQKGGSRDKFYLLGTNYILPRVANKVLKAFLSSKGVPEDNIIEAYTPFHHQDYQRIVGDIKKFAAGGRACVFSMINGDSNVPFYKEFANQGLKPADCPIVAFNVTEDDLRAINWPSMAGHLACQNYFQSIDTRGNQKFVENFKAYCTKNNLPGGSGRVTDARIEAAYFGVYVWKAAVEKAGSFEVDKVRQAVYGLEFNAPGGKKKMHPTNQHTLKPVYIGEILGNGQFRIIAEGRGLISPDSYSRHLHPDGKFPPPTGGSRPTAQTADAGSGAPARKLTAKEVADLFADDIGTWKFKGHKLRLVPDPETGLPGKPVEFEDTIEIRWKEKGKSTEARFSVTIDGEKVPFVGHKEYDAQDGVFVWRSKGEGLPETVSRETYDPKNKIYRGQASYPDGAKRTSTFEVINKNKRHFKAQVEVEGKVVFSEEAVFTRMEEDNGLAKPEPKGPDAE